MPKRKRESHEQGADPYRASKVRKQDVLEKYTQSKKLLHRALKTAKGFERQKLGKRLKLAKSESKIPEILRINREIEALKGLDLGKVTEGHLNKSLLKVKALAESENLPAEVRVELEKPAGTEEEVTALRNVVSGMCNIKQVKEVMEGVVGGMYAVLGIPKPANPKKGAKKEDVKGILKNGEAKNAVIVEPLNKKIEESGTVEAEDEEPAWDGFGSSVEEDIIMEDFEDAEDESGSGSEEDGDEDIKYDSLDEEDISRYEALLGGSSDEESFDEEEYAKTRPSHPQNPTGQSLSLSPSPPPRADKNSQPEIDLESDSDSEMEFSIPSKPKPQSKSKQGPPPLTPKGSTFLPTLMGGYWSGTDSSASDIEDLPSHDAIRKNRPGQAARRAIWEKKYGTGANHIKSGQGSVADKGKGKDDGWDAKRGAKEDGRGRGRGKVMREYTKPAVASRGRGGGRGASGKKEDAGPLHPSWQAAKKAKQSEKTAKFEGKKVTFD